MRRRQKPTRTMSELSDSRIYGPAFLFSSSRLKMFLIKLAAGFIACAIISCMLSAPAAFAQKEEKPYALLFVTVWGPDNRAVYGVKVLIRQAKDKKPHWEIYSDHRGEAAQRLPPGPGDYVVSAETKGVKDMNGKDLQPGDEVSVHFVKEERLDIGLHLK